MFNLGFAKDFLICYASFIRNECIIIINRYQLNGYDDISLASRL